MAYLHPNFKSKAAAKRAIKAGERVTLIGTAIVGGDTPDTGVISIEGPHYPKPHTWWGQAIVEDGVVISIV